MTKIILFIRNCFSAFCFAAILGCSVLSSASWAQSPRAEVFAGFGTPAPSWIGLGFSAPIKESLNVAIRSGWGHYEDLNIFATSATISPVILDTMLYPYLAGGASLFLLRGEGAYQELDGSTLLVTLNVGLGFDFNDQFRTRAGMAFHFPLRLNFPFIELSWAFGGL